MISLFWNCSGVKKRGMATCLSDLIRDHCLDFVGIQETVKKDFSSKFLRKFDPGDLFCWKWIPSVGKAGGILCGVRYDTFDIKSCSAGKYVMKFELWNTCKQMNYCIMVVYGSAHEEFRVEFLTELSDMCRDISCPYILGGDNILRHASEKNKKTRLSHSSELFNSIINSFCLREVDMNGGQYTWSNKQQKPTLEKLDRVLMSNSWESRFPLTFVRKLVEISDHCPLILNTEDIIPVPNKRRDFRFDLNWLKNPEFLPLVAKVWMKPVNSKNPIDIMNIKLKRFKKFFKCWGSNTFGNARKKEDG